MHEEESSHRRSLMADGSKILKDYSDAYVKGKVQVKPKSITGLHDRKNGVRDIKCFQNSVDKDDVRNILAYKKSKCHQNDGKSQRMESVLIQQ